MKHCFTLVITCLLPFSLLFSQTDQLPKVNFKFNFESYGQLQLYNISAPLSLPAFIKDKRVNGGALPVSLDTITDNPFRHGAMYTAIKTRTSIGGKVELQADLYGEYRGFSYGTFNINNTVVYPVFAAFVHDSLRIGKSSLHLLGATGQFLDEQVDEGLMIYNTDLQGTKLALRYKNSQVAFRIYGDLYNAIGLNIDDLIAYSYTHFFNKDSAAIGFSYVLAKPPYALAKNYTYYNVFGHLRTTNGPGYYAQFSFTNGFANSFPEFKGLRRQVAGLIGMTIQSIRSKVAIHAKAEIRYYGQTWNYFHNDGGLRYRKPVANYYETYDNTVGKYLYPLRKFNTPFSQWGVFTEYERFNLLAATLMGDISYKACTRISFQLDYDINSIDARLDKSIINPIRRSGFVYPIFKMAARYCPVDGVYVAFFVSNKTMNLDTGYPTQYLMKKPFAGIEFRITQ